MSDKISISNPLDEIRVNNNSFFFFHVHYEGVCFGVLLNEFRKLYVNLNTPKTHECDCRNNDDDGTLVDKNVSMSDRRKTNRRVKFAKTELRV